MSNSNEIQNLMQSITDATALKIRLNSELESKMQPSVMKMADNNNITGIKDLISSMPECGYRMKLAGRVAMMEEQNKEVDFIKKVDELFVRFLKKDNKELTVIQKLRDIEAVTNDSLNGVLYHLDCKLESFMHFESIKGKKAFSLNGSSNDCMRGELKTCLDTWKDYKSLLKCAERIDLVSISTIG